MSEERKNCCNRDIFIINNKIGRTIVLSLLYSILLSLNGFSNQLHVNNMTSAEGLSNNTIRCLLEDRNGHIRIGTRDGLNRYDGYEFRVFKYSLGDTTGISNNQINCMLESGSHEIWIGIKLKHAIKFCSKYSINNTFQK